MAISTVGFSTQLLGFIGAATVITDIVGTRYTYGRLVQLDNMPALTFKIVMMNKVQEMFQASTYNKVHVQFDCFALTPVEAETLFDAVNTTFERFRDSDGTIEFHQTEYINRTELVQDFETKIYQISTDWEFAIK